MYSTCSISIFHSTRLFCHPCGHSIKTELLLITICMQTDHHPISFVTAVLTLEKRIALIEVRLCFGRIDVLFLQHLLHVLNVQLTVIDQTRFNVYTFLRALQENIIIIYRSYDRLEGDHRFPKSTLTFSGGTKSGLFDFSPNSFSCSGDTLFSLAQLMIFAI